MNAPVTGIDRAVLSAITDAGLSVHTVAAVVDRALAEDLTDGPDLTTIATVPAEQSGRAELVARQAGVLAGLPVAGYAFAVASAGRLHCSPLATDGMAVEAGQPLLVVTGPIRDLLTAERTALNLLTHLSGIATLTRRWVDAVSGTGARIRDTRKTLPGLRELQKYAVRCGGGVNHRMSLSDAALIKDNHVAAAGSVARAYELVAAELAGTGRQLAVEVEVDTVAECRQAIAAGAELILLDNMTPAQLRSCVALAAESERTVRLEASGGLSLAVAAEVAATGVDYLAVGALTHSAPVLDIGLDLITSAAEGADR
jgi:nicotinate-nucleotide pyrophosphorylase (carboxylating)